MARYFQAFAIDDYPEGPLQSCVRDAYAVEGVLRRRFGFEAGEVVRDRKVTRTGVLAAIRSLARRRRRGDDQIIMFSGHGEASEWCVFDDCGRKVVGIDRAELAHALAAFELRHLLVISDSCFSLGMVTRGSRRDEPLVERLDALPSRAFLTATGQHVGYDGGEGGNSPFVGALVDQLESLTEPTLISDLHGRVRAEAFARAPKSRQIPSFRHLSESQGELVFWPAGPPRKPSAPRPQAAAAQHEGVDLIALMESLDLPTMPGGAPTTPTAHASGLGAVTLHHFQAQPDACARLSGALKKHQLRRVFDHLGWDHEGLYKDDLVDGFASGFVDDYGDVLATLDAEGLGRVAAAFSADGHDLHSRDAQIRRIVARMSLGTWVSPTWADLPFERRTRLSALIDADALREATAGLELSGQPSRWGEERLRAELLAGALRVGEVLWWLPGATLAELLAATVPVHIEHIDRADAVLLLVCWAQGNLPEQPGGSLPVDWEDVDDERREAFARHLLLRDLKPLVASLAVDPQEALGYAPQCRADYEGLLAYWPLESLDGLLAHVSDAAIDRLAERGLLPWGPSYVGRAPAVAGLRAWLDPELSDVGAFDAELDRHLELVVSLRKADLKCLFAALRWDPDQRVDPLREELARDYEGSLGWILALLSDATLRRLAESWCPMLDAARADRRSLLRGIGRWLQGVHPLPLP